MPSDAGDRDPRDDETGAPTMTDKARRQLEAARTRAVNCLNFIKGHQASQENRELAARLAARLAGIDAKLGR